MPIIHTKKDKGKCPDCNEWIDLFFDDNLKCNVLKCCKVYSLCNEIKQKKKRKIKKVKQTPLEH